MTIPCNDYGHQDPADGVFYAGFRAYSKSPKLKRSYLQVQLTEKLEENQMYCVSFDLSLADLSRTPPDIGAILSDRKIERGGTAPIVQKPDVQHKSNKTMVYMDGWETVCGTFTGSGGGVLIIGCFGGDATSRKRRWPVPPPTATSPASPSSGILTRTSAKPSRRCWAGWGGRRVRHGRSTAAPATCRRRLRPRNP